MGSCASPSVACQAKCGDGYSLVGGACEATTKEYSFGKERSNIRKLLVDELKQIDGLLDVLIGGE